MSASDPTAIGRSSRIPRRNVSHEVAQHIRSLILRGIVRPHQKIPQDAIAAELGVSRLPVREALLSLEKEGLVSLEAHRGAFVAPIERVDVEDQYEIYAAIHSMAAMRAAAHIDDNSLRRLEEIHRRFQASDDAQVLDDLDFEFHRIINLAGGSRRLRSVLRALLILSRNIPHNFFLSVPNAKARAVRGHAQILRALKARDGHEAAAACVKHLREEGRQVAKKMSDAGFWAEGDRL
jgi:DNA-binding GntR family transcriptional regulator